MTLDLVLFNSLTRRKETFIPLEPGLLRMYNCGPTVYDYAHIGNFRSFLLGDILRRIFEHAGYRVTQVMNITDVGHLTEDDVDRISVGSQRESLDPWALTQRYTESFLEDAESIGMLPAHEYPRATDHIPQMIEMIEKLLSSGHAYRTEESVYYSVEHFPAYGALSGNQLEELQQGARVSVREDKRDPRDFALWKRDPKHLMTWDSPWGTGFPGWHIECSAMSRQYLGETFDIHTGG